MEHDDITIYILVVLLLIVLWASCHLSVRKLVRKTLSNNEDLFDKNYINSISCETENTIEEMRRCLQNAAETFNKHKDPPIKQTSNRTGFLGGMINLFSAGINYASKVADNNERYNSIHSFYVDFSRCYNKLTLFFDVIKDLGFEVKSGGKRDILLLSRILRHYNRKLSIDLHVSCDYEMARFLQISPDMIEANRNIINSYRSETLDLGITLLDNTIKPTQTYRGDVSNTISGVIAVGALAMGAIETHFERQRMKAESRVNILEQMQDDLSKAIDAQNTINKAIELFFLINNYHKVYIAAVLNLSNNLKRGTKGVDLIPLLIKLAESYYGATSIQAL